GAGDLGADSALFQYALLRLPVRDVLRVERGADEALAECGPTTARRRGRSVSDVAQVGRQRSSDDVATARGGRSRHAGTGPGGGRSVRTAGDASRRRHPE